MVTPLQIRPMLIPGFRSRFAHELESPVNLPNLWQLANFMHERICLRIASPKMLSHTKRLPYNERLGILAWIAPVEALVRKLIITSAITFLLMTETGRKLLRRTPKMAIPQGRAPAKPSPLTQQNARIVMPHPGWHTIANHARPAPAPPQPQEPEPQEEDEDFDTRQRFMSLDPKTWRTPFTVLRWRPAEQPRAGIFDAWRDPHLPPPQTPTPTRAERTIWRHFGNPVAVNVARRLEALGRVLANPEPHIQRIARYLARLPRAMLEAEVAMPATRAWQQGDEFYRAALKPFYSALNALRLCQSEHPEPG